MTVHVVFNNCPEQFGERVIISVHLSKKGANAAIEKLNKKDEYLAQYLERFPFKVKP